MTKNIEHRICPSVEDEISMTRAACLLTALWGCQIPCHALLYMNSTHQRHQRNCSLNRVMVHGSQNHLHLNIRKKLKGIEGAENLKEVN